MRKPRNFFNVGVRFKTHAYSVVSRKDVEHTPRDVLTELEEFCARIKRDLAIEALVACGPDDRKRSNR